MTLFWVWSWIQSSVGTTQIDWNSRRKPRVLLPEEVEDRVLEKYREFPGGPVVRTPCFHCWGPRFRPCQEAKILKAALLGSKRKLPPKILKRKDSRKERASVRSLKIWMILSKSVADTWTTYMHDGFRAAQLIIKGLNCSLNSTEEIVCTANPT